MKTFGINKSYDNVRALIFIVFYFRSAQKVIRTRANVFDDVASD